MSDEEFWVKQTKTVAFVVVAIVASVASCCSYETKRIAELAADGVNPIAARCALHGFVGGSSAAVCLSVTGDKR